ncbi:Fc.00g018750.m01.CDS01 [Cosmosporella sp. VM-42]
MANRYDLRSQEDGDRSSYTALPGTTPGEFVRNNITPMKSKLSPGREIPGCHPGRWIFELTHNMFTTCDIFDRARHAKLDTPWQHPHSMVVNGNQTLSPIISTVCLDCHYHFVFKTTWDAQHSADLCHHQQASWPPKDSQFPWHHMVWIGSDSDPNIAKDHSKHYPLLAREFFVCSAPPCTFQITLEISEPRMPPAWIKLLQDETTIRKQLRIAKEQEPNRYELATDNWVTQAPLNLNTYLKNLLEASSPQEVRKISKRNKRFAVLFGPRCFDIFRQLGFSEEISENEGIDEGHFAPLYPGPPTGPSLTTELGTYRAYLEDVRSEVQCLIHTTDKTAEQASYCLPLLSSDLHLEAVPFVGDQHMEKACRPEYKLLGVLPYARREVVVNAYYRQWDLLPSKRRELLEALGKIANDLNDAEFSEFAATQDSVFESQKLQQSTDNDDSLVSSALNFLGLQSPNTYSADELVKAFRNTLVRDPGDAITAKSMLSVMAHASTDDTYQATLLMETDAKMSLNTSKVLLGLAGASGFGPEALENARSKVSEVEQKFQCHFKTIHPMVVFRAIIDSSKTKEEKATYIDAMEAIADHTNSIDLKSTVAEMRRNIGISAPSGGDTSYDKPVNFDLPVGLENIGNTCYLNSLLQYLFTVKPVRDIALNYQSFKLELTDENIKERLLGGNKMQMDRGEAVVAQAFAQELSDLFRNLQTSDQVATRPSQRLANAVLLSTHTLLNDAKQATEVTTTPQPPPLPARPSPAPPSKSNEDVEMQSGITGNPMSESIEIASSQSSQTLVDPNDEDSDKSYEKVENLPTGSETHVIDTVMEDHNDVDMNGIQQGLQGIESSVSIPGVDRSGDKDESSLTNPDVSSLDVTMSNTEEPESVDQKVLTALEHQKRSSGTDQQDVEEVMGSILNRLQAAIKPNSVDEATGIQLEEIMETFFVTTVNYTKKFDEKKYQQEISFDRSITAFPAPEGACSLYDALGRNFDQQIIEESKLSRYTAIKTLPPLLHVLIQRSQSMGSKNGNPVVIPETLYLDRYMDTPHDSPIFQQRVKNWTIANRICDIKLQRGKADACAPSGTFLQNYIQQGTEASTTEEPVGTTSQLSALDEEEWSFDGPVDDDFLLINPSKPDEAPTPEPAVLPEGVEAIETTVRDMMDKELRHREATLEQNFAGLENIPYRLHAVICHRGQLMSGHYWVWIHDFERNVWRKYNDSNVEENPNTQSVLQTLSTSGEPYFLCYVRDGDKDAYVDVPKRDVPTPPPQTDADGDVEFSTNAAVTELDADDLLPPPYLQS